MLPILDRDRLRKCLRTTKLKSTGTNVKTLKKKKKLPSNIVQFFTQWVLVNDTAWGGNFLRDLI